MLWAWATTGVGDQSVLLLGLQSMQQTRSSGPEARVSPRPRFPLSGGISHGTEVDRESLEGVTSKVLRRKTASRAQGEGYKVVMRALFDPLGDQKSEGQVWRQCSGTLLMGLISVLAGAGHCRRAPGCAGRPAARHSVQRSTGLGQGGAAVH